MFKCDYEKISGRHSGEWMNRLTSDTVVVAEGMTQMTPGITGMLIRLLGALILLIMMYPMFSVYKLDLNRPKKSMMRKNMDNMDMKYCMKRLSTRTVLGKSQENIFRLIMDIVYKEKNIDESKMSDQEYDDFIKSAAPKVYDEIKSDIEAFDQKLQQFAKDNGIKKGKLSEGDLPDEGYSITLRELLEGKEPISNTERKKRMGQ